MATIAVPAAVGAAGSDRPRDRARPLALGARVAVVASVLAYALIFRYAYDQFVAPRYTYFGLGYRELPLALRALGLALSVLPALWSPTRLTRPSQLVYWLMYLIVYVPSMYIPFVATRPEITFDAAVRLVLSLFAGISVLGLAYLVPVVRVARPRLSVPAFWLGFSLFALALVAVVAVVSGGRLRWTGLMDVYEQRDVWAEAATGTFAPYAFIWLASVVFPFVIAVGFRARRVAVVVGGVLGQAALFGVGGNKGVLFGALAAVGLPLLVRERRVPLGAAFALVLAVVVGAVVVADALGLEAAAFGITFVLLFRTLSIPALANVQYLDFFATNPHTYFSHFAGIRSLLPYPYPETLDLTIGYAYYSAKIGMNANFWAGDGIAGLGLWGIPAVSVVCAAALWVFDSLARDADPRFAALTLSYILVNFGNIPLFTTLFSGGLLVLMGVFWVLPRRGIWARTAAT